jgi:hypothetical protein
MSRLSPRWAAAPQENIIRGYNTSYEAVTAERDYCYARQEAVITAKYYAESSTALHHTACNTATGNVINKYVARLDVAGMLFEG